MTSKRKRPAGGKESTKAKTSGVRKRPTSKIRAATDSKRTSRKTSGEIGQLREPKSPMPAQHQRRPGLESKLSPQPRYKAPHYKGSGKLNKKVALITGGDSGIGRAIAILFAREGADVAITHLPEEKSDARETIQEIKEEGIKEGKRDH